MNIYGEYPISFNEDRVGELIVKAEGLMTSFNAVCTCNTQEILRLAIVTQSRRHTLGVMIPDGDKLLFKKKYSKNDLNRMNLTSIEIVILITNAENNIIYLPNVSAKNENENTKNDVKELNRADEEKGKREMLWEPAKHAENLFADDELKLIAEKTEGIMQKDFGDGVVMAAVPLSDHEPFSMMPIFCFGQSEKIDTRNYLVFKLVDGNVQS